MRATSLRLSVVLALVAGLLVPGFIAPTRAIATPRTLFASRTFSESAAHGALAPIFAPTHVMLSWSGAEGTKVQYRAGGDSESLPRWRTAPEAHDLGHGRRHYSGALEVSRPETIEWRAHRAGPPVSGVRISYVNTVDGPKETVRVPVVASAAATEPRIITRAEWGADERIKRTRGSCERGFYRVQQLFVHHTAGSNNVSSAAATMRAIYAFHVQDRGWCDIGYNFVISPDGRLFEGRWARRYQPWEAHDTEDSSGKAVSGAHVAGLNSGSIGVSMMGNFENVSVPRPARRKLVRFLAWEADRHNLDPTARHTYRSPVDGTRLKLPVIAGHRDGGQTGCPGGRLYRALRQIRRAVADRIGRDKPSSELTLTVPKYGVYGKGTAARAKLETRRGRALGGQTVDLYGRGPDSGWSLRLRSKTNENGIARFRLTPARRTRFFAIFHDARAAWGSQSDSVLHRVRPDVQLEPDGTVPDAKGVHHLAPTATTLDLSGTVAPDHTGHIVRVWLSEVRPDGTYSLISKHEIELDKESAYAVTVDLPAEVQSFRAFTTFAQDGDHASGRSKDVFLTRSPI